MSDFHVQGIPVHLIDHFWKNCEPFVKRALDHSCGEFTAADIRAFCKDRLTQLWVVTENDKVVAVCTTEIVTYPQRRHCRVITLGGTASKEWLQDLDIIICAWAKQQGCQAVEAFVRKGFVPVLAKYGFGHKYSTVVKDI